MKKMYNAWFDLSKIKTLNFKLFYMQKITPFLWFDGQAEEAANFYVSIFKNSKVTSVTRQGDKAFSVTFILDGQEFYALNAGPQFKFTEAISFFVSCDTQEEIDEK